MEFENEVEVFFNIQVLQGLECDPFFISSIERLISEDQGIDQEDLVKALDKCLLKHL